jgi:hypothetical protein
MHKSHERGASRRADGDERVIEFGLDVLSTRSSPSLNPVSHSKEPFVCTDALLRVRFLFYEDATQYAG